jgi:hypothetical protein
MARPLSPENFFAAAGAAVNSKKELEEKPYSVTYGGGSPTPIPGFRKAGEALFAAGLSDPKFAKEVDGRMSRFFDGWFGPKAQDGSNSSSEETA